MANFWIGKTCKSSPIRARKALTHRSDTASICLSRKRHLTQQRERDHGIIDTAPPTTLGVTKLVDEVGGISVIGGSTTGDGVLRNRFPGNGHDVCGRSPLCSDITQPTRGCASLRPQERQVDYRSGRLLCGSTGGRALGKGSPPRRQSPLMAPLSFSRAGTHVLQFACSKAGFVLYSLDPAEAVTDPEGAKKSLGKALEVTEANVLVTQEAGSDVSYLQLTKFVIPEIRIFDFADGQPFFTPRFPHLRFPIHTGFDNDDKEGMVAYKHMLSPTGKLSEFLRDCGVPAPNGRSPLYGELVKGKDGLLAKGKTMTNEEVYKANIWPEFTSVLNKEHTKVGGIGVIF
eukprot:scaffold22128_cov39-Attheya_sp.AAC.2